MEWFIKGSTPFKGMKLSTVSEILSIHDYESKTLTKAFADITGIQVSHELLDEGKLVDKIEVEIQSGKPIYDFWMNDSTSSARIPATTTLSAARLRTSWLTTARMSRIRASTSKTSSACSGCLLMKALSMTRSAFANLYWFRYDRSKKRAQVVSKAKFGYVLGVPVDWSAYEEIADFFTNTVKEIDGQKVYGHMDYGKKDPSLGWALPMPGRRWRATATRSANGKPVDQWGIRAKNGIRSDLPISRGGDAIFRRQSMRPQNSSSR